MSSTKKRRFAEGTRTSINASRDEIRRMLEKAGCTRLAFLQDEDGSERILFQREDRWYQFQVREPTYTDPTVRYYASGKSRPKDMLLVQKEQVFRERWRAAALILKADLLTVEAGVATFQERFLPNVLLPNGQTFGTWAVPALEELYASGAAPKLPLLAAPQREV